MKKIAIILVASSVLAYNTFSVAQPVTKVLENRTDRIESIINDISN